MAKVLKVKNLYRYDNDMRSFIGVIDELIYSDKLGNLVDYDRLMFIDDVLGMYINGGETYTYLEDEEEWGDDDTQWYLSNFDIETMKSLGWITQVDENTLELDF